jgi:hypothetical protein
MRPEANTGIPGDQRGIAYANALFAAAAAHQIDSCTAISFWAIVFTFWKRSPIDCAIKFKTRLICYTVK